MIARRPIARWEFGTNVTRGWDWWPSSDRSQAATLGLDHADRYRVEVSNAMRVLVTESEPDTNEGVIRQLVEAGHEVVRCHEPGLPAFPCNGLNGGRCPIHEKPGVDVAVTVRGHVHRTPMPLEDGITCALRHHVPVVVAGIHALGPFDRFGVSVAEEHDVVAVCRSTVAAREAVIAEIVTEIAVAGLRIFKIQPDDLLVVAHLDGDLLTVDMAARDVGRQFGTALQAHLRAEIQRRLPDVRVVAVRLNERTRLSEASPTASEPS